MPLHKLSFLFLTTFLCAFLSASAILLPTQTQSQTALSQSLSVSNQLAQVAGTSSLCSTLSSTSPIPSGYGASYNLFSTTREPLLSATCNTNNTLSVTLGNSLATTYIWNQGYYTKNGSTWNPITFSGTNTTGNWIIGQASATPSLTTTEQATQNYLAAYVCTYQSSTWKCGCSDTTCAVPKWNLQGVKKVTTTTPTTPTTTAGLFPGTNLKFYPGFVIASTVDEATSSMEKRWQQLFTASPDRKTSYRPKGVYGGIAARYDWKQFYTNESVRPSDPLNPADPGYNWSKLDAVFNINAVQNEGALVFIEIGDISYSTAPKAPQWLVKAPYNGIFITSTIDASGSAKAIPKYYRYSGPDSLGRTNVGAQPPIADEWVDFHQALRDHLIATGNINKIMGVGSGGEAYGNPDPASYPDWNATNYYHGSALRAQLLAKIWAQSHIQVFAGSLTSGTYKTIAWDYMQNPLMAMGFPDMKLNGTDNITSASRFYDPTNTIYQKDARPLLQATEGNGQRASTYFAAGIANPWGYSNVTKTPQTMSHVLWALSGPPKGANKDSGLGQAGDDPAGLLPASIIVLDWGRSWETYSPTIDDVHQAIDTFGPPGTFAFPYFPVGYNP